MGARPGVHLGSADVPKSLGVVEVLSDADQMDLYSFEEVLKTATENFVQAGLALGQIRDRRLYPKNGS